MANRKWSDVQIDGKWTDKVDEVTSSRKWSDNRVDKLTTEAGQMFKPIRYWVKGRADNLVPPSTEVPRKVDFQAQKLANKMSQNIAKKVKTKKDFGLAGFLRV